MRIKTSDLKKICYDYGIGKPSQYVAIPRTIISGKKKKKSDKKPLY